MLISLCLDVVEKAHEYACILLHTLIFYIFCTTIIESNLNAYRHLEENEFQLKFALHLGIYITANAEDGSNTGQSSRILFS